MPTSPESRLPLSCSTRPEPIPVDGYRIVGIKLMIEDRDTPEWRFNVHTFSYPNSYSGAAWPHSAASSATPFSTSS